MSLMTLGKRVASQSVASMASFVLTMEQIVIAVDHVEAVVLMVTVALNFKGGEIFVDVSNLAKKVLLLVSHVGQRDAVKKGYSVSMINYILIL